MGIAHLFPPAPSIWCPFLLLSGLTHPNQCYLISCSSFHLAFFCTLSLTLPFFISNVNFQFSFSAMFEKKMFLCHRNGWRKFSRKKIKDKTRFLVSMRIVFILRLLRLFFIPFCSYLLGWMNWKLIHREKHFFLWMVSVFVSHFGSIGLRTCMYILYACALYFCDVIRRMKFRQKIECSSGTF